MTSMGRSLAFHLKYPKEMEAIYWDEETKLIDHLEDSERIGDMVDAVGEAACEQAAGFLLACASDVAACLDSLCNARIRTPPRIVARNWYVEVDLWPKDKRRRNYVLVAGLSLDDSTGEILSYVWMKGGSAAESAIIKVLKMKKGVVDLRDMGWSTGCVALKRTPIHVTSSLEYERSWEELRVEVVKPFGALKKKEVDRLLALAFD